MSAEAERKGPHHPSADSRLSIGQRLGKRTGGCPGSEDGLPFKKLDSKTEGVITSDDVPSEVQFVSF